MVIFVQMCRRIFSESIYGCCQRWFSSHGRKKIAYVAIIFTFESWIKVDLICGQSTIDDIAGLWRTTTKNKCMNSSNQKVPSHICAMQKQKLESKSVLEGKSPNGHCHYMQPCKYGHTVYQVLSLCWARNVLYIVKLICFCIELLHPILSPWSPYYMVKVLPCAWDYSDTFTHVECACVKIWKDFSMQKFW